MKLKEMKQKLETMIDELRFKHTMGVMEVADSLSERYSIDEKGLKIAALLHDCAKGMKIPEQLEYARLHSIPLSYYDLQAPGVIHARIGAYIANKEFGIVDPKVLEAIHYHPTGYEWMSDLGKVLYCADYLDPNRKLESTERLTKIALEDLNQAVLEITVEKYLYVRKRMKSIHPDAIKLYNHQVGVQNNKVIL